MSESEKMAQMDAWLDQVCAALDVDREVFAEVTLGDDFENVGRFCGNGQLDYTAEDVIRTLLG